MLTSIKNDLNRCRLAAVFISCCLLTLYTAAQQNCTNCGVISRQERIFNPGLNAFIVPRYERDEKRLFYDSMMIMERRKIVSNTDAKGKETWRIDVMGYTFADYRKKTFTNYTNFSSTAGKLYFSESEGFGNLGDAASHFFDTTPKQYQHTLLLSDTIINGHRCSRMLKFTISSGDTTVIDTIYYVPEAQSPLAYYNKLNVNNQRCSVIRMDYNGVIIGLKGYSTINVISHNLSKKELKVFAAWKRNAAKHPVKK